ncbi:FAD-binding oxidoreductase [Rhizobiaceae bacterium]|nr:FAD-binding oxidoreductase [Rhizobiaceae bacterium]
MNDLLARFAALVDEGAALHGNEATAAYVTDTRDRLGAPAALVLRPRETSQIAAILALATETRTPIIPQGGNTGLVGAGLPTVSGGGHEIIVSLQRMDKVLDVDPATNTMTVEAGCILQRAQEAAADHERLFPLSLGAEGSARIGGNIGSNAGGTGVLAYGNTRELTMGLEVVLPTGEVLDLMSRLRKDNTGYDLKNLFVGAEGTLGIVTKAVLKLFPRPAGREVAYVACASIGDALGLLSLAQSKAGAGLTAFEFMSQTAMAFTLKNAQGIRPPLSEPSPWAVLLEISSGRSAEDARATMEAVLTQAYETGTITDATIAESGAQQAAFWKLREEMSWAQKPEGGSIKHDIAVPVGQVPAFVAAADAAVLAILPEARICNFGHLGDGNLHYNISQPVGWEAARFFEFEEAIHDAVYAEVAQQNGSISAEHGIGQIKRERLAASKNPVALALMRRLKQEIDPAGIMNPGKVL